MSRALDFEDAPPLEPVEPAPTLTDTEPPEIEPANSTRKTDPAPYATAAQVAELLEAVNTLAKNTHNGIRAVHSLAANTALEVEALKVGLEHATDVARCARSAAEKAEQAARAGVKLLNEKVLVALYELDKKVDEDQTRNKGELDALAGVVDGFREVVAEHLAVSSDMRDIALEISKRGDDDDEDERLTVVEAGE